MNLNIERKEDTKAEQSTISGHVETVVMCADLKLLYKLKNGINILVTENFGYSPNTGYYNRLEKRLREQELIVKSIYPQDYEMYLNKEYI